MKVRDKCFSFVRLKINFDSFVIKQKTLFLGLRHINPKEHPLFN